LTVPDGPVGPSAGASMAVGRTHGTVVVTVEGALDDEGGRRLANLLTDLIEGQGNGVVAVDLARATIQPEAVEVFVAAGRQAGARSIRFILRSLPVEADRALRSGGLCKRVEVVLRGPVG
jgi:hypothetical protein